MKEVNPDVVILHNLHGYYLNYPLLFDNNYAKKPAYYGFMEALDEFINAQE